MSSKMLLLNRIIFMNVVTKIGCRHSVQEIWFYYSLATGILWQQAQTAVLTCTSCDILLVAATLRMTELAQLEEFYTATQRTLLVSYTKCVMEQVNFRALFICGYP